MVRGRRLFRITAPIVLAVAGLLAVQVEAFAQPTSISPDFGPIAGGTPVTISATLSDFSGTCTVTIDGAPLSGVTVASNAITGTTTADAALPAPTVSAISPTSGGTGGGTFVTITGTNFADQANVVVSCSGDGSGTLTNGFTYDAVTGVAIGGTSASFTANGSNESPTTISLDTPPGIAGVADVVVTTPSGSSGSSGNNLYAYTPGGPSISTIGPVFGLTTGGNQITITGSNFVPGTYANGSSATTATIGGAAVTGISVTNTTTLTGYAPAGTAGAADVTVTTPAGTANPGSLYYLYEPAAQPTVTSVSPNGGTIANGGSVAGGSSVTISGTNFTGATSVTFGGSPVNSFNVTGPGTITTVSPAHAAGTVDVVVTVTSGSTYTSATNPNDQFTYVTPPPSLTGISPSSGSTTGGTSVTITGQYFTGATAVTLGGTEVTSFSVVNDDTITAVTAAHSSGSVSVAVTTPTVGGSGGTGTSTTPLYTYVTPSQPVVTSITPSSGSTAGGNIVTIIGSGFTGATSVTFAGAAGTHLTVVTDGEITVTAPAGTAGPANVVITTPGGTTSTTYTYVTPAAVLPTVTSITPNQGTTLGGTKVTITGTNFSGTPQVTINGVAAAEVTVVNSTTITAVTPAGTGTDVPVVVTTSFGSSTAADIYSYVAPTPPTPAVPTITSVSPSSGTTLGLTPVTITGTNLTGATSVTFGGSPATDVIVVSATEITALTPPGAVGSVTVAVTTPGGTATDPNAYQYVTAAPTVTAVSPATGTNLGGSSVTITGTNFTGATSVMFGSNAATNVTVLNATTITATTPAGTGVVNVSVTTPAGTGTGTSLYTYLAQSPPTVTAISPNGGSIANGGNTAGGASVTITGTNFTGATSVTIGGTAVTFMSVVNSTTITAITPAHAAGAVNVVVTTPAGTGTGSDLFTYVEGAPTVTGISPNSGPVAGGTPITITGTNFTGATSVTIGGNAPTSVTFVSPTEITAVTPAGTAGPVNVTVTTPAGTGIGTNIFTYVAPPASMPTVTSISPNSGMIGTVVTITGTNFTSTPSVSFGSVPATNVTVVSPTEITAVAPSNTGTVPVTVTTTGGTSTPGAADQFTYVKATTSLTLTQSVTTTSYGQAVTFTATVTGNAPTGTVSFTDNGSLLGTEPLVPINATTSRATLTTTTLPQGTDQVTASYSGDANNTADPATVTHYVNAPADSVKLRQLQIATMTVESSASGAAISGAISNAIDEGFSGLCPAIPTPNGSGFTYCFDGRPPPQAGAGSGQQARASIDSDFAALRYAGAPPGTPSSAPQNILAADFPPSYPTKPAAVPYAPPREWLAWVDVRGTDFEQNSVGNDLKGLQGNAMFGLTHRFSPNFLFGVTTGYEDFNYTSVAYNGALGGDGPTAGAYLGWRLGHLRFEAAGTWSDIFVSGSSGSASGNFSAKRWLGFGGVSGSFDWMGMEFEPAAQFHTLWEHDNAYTDSLGTAQASNAFDTGTASGGVKISHALAEGDVNLVPYLGFYADYYFTMDSANTTTPGVTPVPLLQGWAGRATGGLTAVFAGGTQVSAAAEYGGIGNDFQIWTVMLRGSVPF